MGGQDTRTHTHMPQMHTYIHTSECVQTHAYTEINRVKNCNDVTQKCVRFILLHIRVTRDALTYPHSGVQHSCGCGCCNLNVY